MQEDTFYIILTIPGTKYKGVEVVIKNPLITIREQIERIVEHFEIPRMDNGWNSVYYLLGRPNEDGDVEIFEFDDEDGRELCLLDYNVSPGDHLVLVSYPIAGGDGTHTECIAAESDMDDESVNCFSISVEGCSEAYDVDAVMIERERSREREQMEQLAQERERLERERERLVQERMNLMREREALKEEIKFLERKRESLERKGEELERVQEQLKQERMAQYMREREELERMLTERLTMACAIEVERDQENDDEEATPSLMTPPKKEKSGFGRKLLERLNILRQKVYGSIFAPAEIRPLSHMLIQVYLHLYEETEKVKELAKEPQKEAERRDFIPLECELKKGDKVDVLLNIFGKKLLMSEKKSLVWQGSFTKCSFDYLVPNSDEVNELSCIAMLSVNGIPVGEMSFVTSVVDFPKDLTPEVIAHNYHKVFISYAHEDMPKVKRFHVSLKKHKIEHFFDRDTLVTGDIFPLEIQEYINTADLFVLFWSRNAAESDYVQLELNQALERTYPKVQPPSDAKLRIYPYSIEPRADYPESMQPFYHFGEL